METIFFIISKLAWIFLSPSNLLIFLFALGTLLVFWRKRSGKPLLAFTSLTALSLMIYPFSDYAIKPLEERFSAPTAWPKHIDGIILLGGGEDLERALSWNRPELGLGGDRYIGAKELANRYPNAPVIFSGGSGFTRLQDTAGEGHFAQQILTTIGIAPERLIIESNSRNTAENFSRLKPLLPNPNGTYFLVTSAFHMPRSVGIARQQAIRVIAYPVDYRSSSAQIRRVDFNFYDHLQALEPAWKEWIGLTVYYWTQKTSDWFPKP